ncbi:hypothetical protein J3459_007524 [Metarhizium acridum]|uniref:RING-type domain-containing protein n=1 Tax=Metarhizium acridum (strain CQMa 102) TaxID=655827 RepID=E9EFJ9_METAQ|nr:uncharacterized protein MAC_08647 [Metarhizium acridum CQMa 102]EFY85291.1 hypothetical protein MAC_08647 [Metarhizium acridum CQMa 102]KAG8416547.1 hypothetical protein J3458_007129 [Metarhizium acridum]KAG8427110.1 hypothetical protein J3459_007524 [Metarhizium acridum]
MIHSLPDGMESCSTCAAILRSRGAPTPEKMPDDRIVSCCGRVICGSCIQNNPRFSQYCPYCQISSTPSPLPQGLKDPPSYTLVSQSRTVDSGPPPYTLFDTEPQPTKNEGTNAEVDEKSMADDTLHFLNHDHDSITSLSFRYGVPAAALRRANNITSDYLLQGRKTILIPGEYYKGGVSLSPTPIDGEDEELRKSKIRRFMTSCKVSDYNIAEIYLEKSGYDFGASVQAYFDDEAWEREQARSGANKAITRTKNLGFFWRA